MVWNSGIAIASAPDLGTSLQNQVAALLHGSIMRDWWNWAGCFSPDSMLSAEGHSSCSADSFSEQVHEYPGLGAAPDLWTEQALGHPSGAAYCCAIHSADGRVPAWKPEMKDSAAGFQHGLVPVRCFWTVTAPLPLWGKKKQMNSPLHSCRGNDPQVRGWDTERPADDFHRATSAY